VGVGVGVFAVGVGVLLLPYPLLPVAVPQAATSNASNRIILIGRARLRCFMSSLFLLNGSVKLGFCRAVSSPSGAGIVRETCRDPVFVRILLRPRSRSPGLVGRPGMIRAFLSSWSLNSCDRYSSKRLMALASRPALVVGFRGGGLQPPPTIPCLTIRPSLYWFAKMLMSGQFTMKPVVWKVLLAVPSGAML
jgi:hypothetical protein